MTQNTAIKKLKNAVKKLDTESAHIVADDIIVTFLKSNGYKKLAAAYEAVPKWYS